jgi:hypothetical protein
MRPLQTSAVDGRGSLAHVLAVLSALALLLVFVESAGFVEGGGASWLDAAVFAGEAAGEAALVSAAPDPRLGEGDLIGRPDAAMGAAVRADSRPRARQPR